VLHCTLLTWTLILLTFGNNILLQSFNWPQPVHYVPTDKINASIRIRIRIGRILKVKIRELNFDQLCHVIGTVQATSPWPARSTSASRQHLIESSSINVCNVTWDILSDLNIEAVLVVLVLICWTYLFLISLRCAIVMFVVFELYNYCMWAQSSLCCIAHKSSCLASMTPHTRQQSVRF